MTDPTLTTSEALHVIANLMEDSDFPSPDSVRVEHGIELVYVFLEEHDRAEVEHSFIYFREHGTAYRTSISGQFVLFSAKIAGLPVRGQYSVPLSEPAPRQDATGRRRAFLEAVNS